MDAAFADVDRWDSPGAAISIVREGEIIYSRGYGSAQLEYGIPITPATVFHVASVSKQFTCFATLLLAAEGKLSLDDDIRQHLPDVPDFGSKITIRHLMHHTSGLRDQWELLIMAGWRMDDVITRDHILGMVRRQRELNFAPGSAHLYSNTGYTLLAELVAKVSGQSFTDFTAERIFKPLGMSHTHFHGDHEQIVPNRAYSYSKTEDGYRNSVLSYANVGATSLFTTSEDLCRWLANFDQPRVGSADVTEQMHARGKLNDGKQIDYAAGLEHGMYRGVQTIGHSGGDAGFRAHALRVPKYKLGVVVLSNFGSFNPYAAVTKALDVLLADQLDTPPGDARTVAKSEPVSVEPEVLDRYAGLYHLENGALVTIRRLGPQLVAEIAQMPRIVLEPRSDTQFFLKEFGAVVTFKESDGQQVRGLTAVMLGQTMRGERIAPTAPETLKTLVGQYYSPELDTTYVLVERDGRLIAMHQRHRDAPLHALGGLKFAGSQWFSGTFEFERDDAGNVLGLRASTGRARNLRFEKRAVP